jgi:hypothetical protein
MTGPTVASRLALRATALRRGVDELALPGERRKLSPGCARRPALSGEADLPGPFF